MDLIKKFMKIGGFKTREELEAYGEDRFFNDFPQARQYAKGGAIEAYPQIATFDKAFSYGVKPGPQYLAHGGSAYPMAQTEAQFFVPVYTNVYNPYNKEMGGSNIEMYPNAKVMPHWGPTNVWFQEGGQEGMEQEQPELDRIGAQNRTGAFANMLKSAAAKSNARTAMNQMGMAKYGKQLSKYDPGGETKYTVSGDVKPYVTEQMSPTSSQFASQDKLPPTYSQQLKQNYDALLASQGLKPGQGGMWVDPDQAAFLREFYRQQGYNSNPRYRGYMNDFLPSMYDWNNMDQFMYQVKGSPKYKWKTDVPGQGKNRGVSNMPFIQAYFPELYGDPDAAQKVLNDPKYAERRKQLGLTRYTETPVGLFKRRTRRDYYFGEPGSQAPSTFKDWGTGAGAQQPAAKSNQSQTNQGMSPYGPYKDGYKFPQTPSVGVPPLLQNNPAYSAPPQTPGINIPGMPGSSPSQASPNTVIPYAPGMSPSATASSTAGTTNTTSTSSGTSGTPSATSGQTPASSSSSTTTTTSQAPSNADSMDAATAQKKAGAIDPSVYINQDYIDAQQAAASGQAPAQEYLTGAPYRTQVGPPAEPSNIDYSEPINPYEYVMSGNTPITMTAQPDPNAYLTGPPERVPVGPVVGPEGYAYGGYTGYKFGGSYNKGDVVYMTDDEIAEFVRNGGQIEEVD